jgi:2-phosphosulfolactate phosphatase
VQTIEQAVEARGQDSSLLLAGEREGYRIDAKVSGGVEFDLGNSPREFTPEAVAGKTIVITTTNGTRALKACHRAIETLAASFLNLEATIAYLRARTVRDFIVVCSGTHEEAAYEDTLAAGALVDALWPMLEKGHIADSAQIARTVYQAAAGDLARAICLARNGRRLLNIPELRDDVSFCLRRDASPVVTRLESNGCIVALR